MATILGKYFKEIICCIKTDIGFSDWQYSHSKEYGIFGTGQGSVQSYMHEAWQYHNSLISTSTLAIVQDTLIQLKN